MGARYVYSTPEYALIKLPFEILQAVFGAGAAMLLVYPLGIGKLFDRVMRRG